MNKFLTRDYTVIAGLFAMLLLVLNPILIGSSFAQPGPSNDTLPPTDMSEDKKDLQITGPGNKILKDKSMTSSQANTKGKFCIKGTGPGTGNTCIPCDPNNRLQAEPECTLPKAGTMSKDQPKLPKTVSSWFNSGLQELETEKKLPSGTGKALASFDKGNPSGLLNICKAITKDPTADVKSGDCNSLTGKGEAAEETKWIIAGYAVGKIFEESENNSTNPSTNKPTNSE